MARRPKRDSGGSGAGLVIALLTGGVLLVCLVCGGSGAVYYVARNKAAQPGPGFVDNVPAPGNRPIEQGQPREKLMSVTYRVAGNPTPDQQAQRIRQTIGALPGVDPGSVSVTPTEIHFHLSRRFTLEQAYDTVTKTLGYQVTLTTTTDAP